MKRSALERSEFLDLREGQRTQVELVEKVYGRRVADNLVALD